MVSGVAVRRAASEYADDYIAGDLHEVDPNGEYADKLVNDGQFAHLALACKQVDVIAPYSDASEAVTSASDAAARELHGGLAARARELLADDPVEVPE